MKRLRHSKKVKKWVYEFSKEKGWNHHLTIVRYKSEYKDYTIRRMTRAEYIEACIAEKLKKWEKKHPCPVQDNDLFKDEYLTIWQNSRKAAELHIRDFVVSVYGKLPLYGRYRTKENFRERILISLDDKQREGPRINDLNPKESVLMIAAQKITDNEARKDKTFICSRITNYDGSRGRIILPSIGYEKFGDKLLYRSAA